LRDGDVLNIPSASSWIHIKGAVSRPGRYELGSRDSLRTLLMLGGDALPSADTTRALLVRWIDSASSESTWVDMGTVKAGSFNPSLRNGDRFYVYYIPQFQVLDEVSILGEVQRPGGYPIKEGRDRITDIVRAAGGFLPGADLAAIQVRRENLRTQEDPELQRLLRLSRRDLTNSEYEVLQTKLAGQRLEYRIDWARLQSDPNLDVLLLGGDVIRVFRVINSVRVDGQVRHPGILSYRPGLGLNDYVKASGGFSERAWPSKIRVTRSVTGQTFLAKDVTQLDPGDLIWVPEKVDLTFWDQTRTVLTAAAQVATVILAFNSVHR
jgi:protein involved in polysaccharide export with SLBB domain